MSVIRLERRPADRGCIVFMLWRGKNALGFVWAEFDHYVSGAGLKDDHDAMFRGWATEMGSRRRCLHIAARDLLSRRTPFTMVH